MKKFFGYAWRGETFCADCMDAHNPGLAGNEDAEIVFAEEENEVACVDCRRKDDA